jgi:hypothetical protein
LRKQLKVISYHHQLLLSEEPEWQNQALGNIAMNQVITYAQEQKPM